MGVVNLVTGLKNWLYLKNGWNELIFYLMVEIQESLKLIQ